MCSDGDRRPADEEDREGGAGGAVADLRAAAGRGLGSGGGFKFIVEDRSGNLRPERTLQSADRDRLIDAVRARKTPKQARACPITVFRADVAAAVRRPRPRAVRDDGRQPAATCSATLQIYLGSLYVNDFNLFGRTWQVIVQAEGEFRNDLSDVRAADGAQRERRHGAAGHASAT